MTADASGGMRIRRLLEAVETADAAAAEAALERLHRMLKEGKTGWEQMVASGLEKKLRSRLVKILGMTGSSAVGEARAAIARARAVAAHGGVSWTGLFGEEAGGEARGDAETVFGQPFAERPKPPPPPPPPPRQARPEPRTKPPPKAPPRAVSQGAGFWTVQQCDSSYEGIWYTVIATADTEKAERIFRDRCATVRDGGGVRLRMPGGRIAREWRRPS